MLYVFRRKFFKAKSFKMLQIYVITYLEGIFKDSLKKMVLVFVLKYIYYIRRNNHTTLLEWKLLFLCGELQFESF